MFFSQGNKQERKLNLNCQGFRISFHEAQQLWTILAGQSSPRLLGLTFHPSLSHHAVISPRPTWYYFSSLSLSSVIPPPTWFHFSSLSLLCTMHYAVIPRPTWSHFSSLSLLCSHKYIKTQGWKCKQKNLKLKVNVLPLHRDGPDIRLL